MAYDHEYNDVMMRIGHGAGAMVYLGTAGFRATAKLVQFLARMAKKEMLDKGEYKSFQEFMRLTEGKFDIVNVPFSDKAKMDNLVADMDATGIHFYGLPDLNKNDGFVQVAIMREDAQKFNALYERYVLNTLDGGKKELTDLTNFTNGKISLISIPYNDEKKESLQMLQNDLDKLKINYTVMPDLKVGDGKIQLSVASADLPKLQHWFELYRDDMLKVGIDIGNMENISVSRYMEMGQMTEEQYMSAASAEVQEKVAEFQQKTKGPCEQIIDQMDNQILSVSDERYYELKKNPDYVEVTINNETLVATSKTAQGLNLNPEFAQYFSSRIPGTYGVAEQVLVLHKKQVFSTDGGDTYIAFIPKDKKPMVFDSKGVLLPGSERQTGRELYTLYYDPVHRNFNTVAKDILAEKVKDVAMVAGADVKAPMLPVKAK